MKLGIFDSGIGGQAVAIALRKHFPSATIKTVNDFKNVPYGDKATNEVIQLTEKAIQPLLESQCDIIILACNTATALAIDYLRLAYPHQKFIGIEPMVKKAAELTQTNVITICATPRTLQSERYKNLISKFAKHCTIIEPDCSEWAYMIEYNQIDDEHISNTINNSLRQQADVIVLGCTHYHWIKDRIEMIAGDKAIILEPSSAIADRVESLLTKAA